MALDLAVSSLAARALGQTHSSSLTSGSLVHSDCGAAIPKTTLRAYFSFGADNPMLAALSDVFKALQGPDKAACAQGLLNQSPACDELLGLWDAQQKVRPVTELVLSSSGWDLAMCGTPQRPMPCKTQ